MARFSGGDSDQTPWPLADASAMIQHLRSLGVAGGDAFAELHARRDPELYPPATTRQGYTVRVDLDGAKPPIWRRLRLASDLTLDRFHEVLQVAMGWADSHLHQFVAGPGARDWKTTSFLTDFMREEGEEGIPEADVRLDQVIVQPGDRLYYEYDFGDSWWHTIRLEKVDAWSGGDPDAFCVTGRRACPPEDVGGISGYEEVLGFLAGHIEGADPEWAEHKIEWMPLGFDPEALDLDEINDLLALGPTPSLSDIHPMALDLVGKSAAAGLSVFKAVSNAAARAEPLSLDETRRAVRRYVALLEALGDGVELTSAGYLSPRVVSTLYDQLGMSQEWIGKGNREDQTQPVLRLRQSATALGLVRKANGWLLTTNTGRRLLNDPEGLWRHIASKLPLGRAHERDAGALVLFGIAADPRGRIPWDSILQQMDDLGWQVQQASSYAPVGWAEPTFSVLEVLAGGLASSMSGLSEHSEERTRVARAVVAWTKNDDS